MLRSHAALPSCALGLSLLALPAFAIPLIGTFSVDANGEDGSIIETDPFHGGALRVDLDVGDSITTFLLAKAQVTVPEPMPLTLLSFGLLGAAAAQRRKPPRR